MHRIEHVISVTWECIFGSTAWNPRSGNTCHCGVWDRLVMPFRLHEWFNGYSYSESFTLLRADHQWSSRIYFVDKHRGATGKDTAFDSLSRRTWNPGPGYITFYTMALYNKSTWFVDGKSLREAQVEYVVVGNNGDREKKRWLTFLPRMAQTQAAIIKIQGCALHYQDITTCSL